MVGSSKLNQFLTQDNLQLEEGEEVDLIVTHITDAGVNVIINEKHRGLIYKNELFEELRTGDRVIGYIKQLRPDGKIDVSRQKIGFEKISDFAERILQELELNDGFLGLHDKSHPDEIKTVLEMSKKTFKQTIGTLYKQKMIVIKEDGIYSV